MRTIQDITNGPPWETLPSQRGSDIHDKLPSLLEYLTRQLAPETPNSIVRTLTVRISPTITNGPFDAIFALAMNRGFELFWDGRFTDYNVLRFQNTRPARRHQHE